VDDLSTSTTMQATYARMPDGKTWGIRSTSRLRPGDAVEVHTRGKWELRVVKEIVHEGQGYWLATLEAQ